MSSQPPISQQIIDAVSLRKKITADFKIMESRKKTFNETVKKLSVKTSFSLVKDAIYYKEGGYPNKNSKPKINELCEKFSDAIQGLTLLNRDDIDLKEILASVGIKNIEFTDDVQSSITKAQSENSSDVQQLNEIVTSSLALQKDICDNSDKIKINIYKNLPSEYKYSKENKAAWRKQDFLKNVSFLSKKELDKVIKEREDLKIDSKTFEVIEDGIFNELKQVGSL